METDGVGGLRRAPAEGRTDDELVLARAFAEHQLPGGEERGEERDALSAAPPLEPGGTRAVEADLGGRAAAGHPTAAWPVGGQRGHGRQWREVGPPPLQIG